MTIEPGFSNQALIDAFYSAGVMLVPARPWSLMSKAGLRLNALAKNRKAVYDGPALDDLTKLTVAERRLVKWKLSLI